MSGKHPHRKVRGIKAAGGAPARIERLARIRLGQNRLLLFIFALVLFVTFMRFPAAAASDRLDPSWMQAYGYFLKNGWQAGVDYIFTFGPLGYFFAPVYDADLFWISIAIQSIIALAAAIVFGVVVSRLRGPLEKLACGGIFLFAVPFGTVDALYLSFVTAFTVLMLEDSRWRNRAIPVFLVLLGFLALVKFIYFLLSALCVAALCICVWRQRSMRWALATFASYGGALAALWILAGQNLVNMPRYISASFQISKAYNVTMMLGGEIPVVLAVVILLYLAGIVAMATFARPLTLVNVITGTVLAAVLFLSWKIGFVRQYGHTRIFFVTAALAPFLIARPCQLQEMGNRLFSVLKSCAVIISVAAFFAATNGYSYTPDIGIERWDKRLSRNFEDLRDLSGVKTRNEAHVEELKEKFDLPKVRAEVGDFTIDILPPRQAVVFLNELNYRPRPVFQGYAAIAPWLLEANRAFLESGRAPEYILADLLPIDGRFPTMEDGEAFKAVLRNYVPVLEERNYVLMKLKKETEAASADDFTSLLDVNAAFGEWVRMDAADAKWQLLSLDIQPSGVGRLLTFLYKPPIMHLETEMANGEVRRYRINMLMVEQGFIINPLIESGKDILKCYTGGALPRVAAFRVVVESQDERYFRRRIGINLTGTDAFIPEYDVDGIPR